MKRRSRARFILEGIEGVALLGAALCSWPLSRRWLDHWGARKEELERAWPGDALVSPGWVAHTRGIDIAAPAELVWKWIVQFGLGKAGFYSYELLERLIGIPVTNIESIEPTMQSLTIGDEVLLHPKAPGIPVGLLEHARHICFGKQPVPNQPATESSRSWSFYVEPLTGDSCRLVLRGCIQLAREASLLQRFANSLEMPVDFVMEQRMLRTVKRLAESDSLRRAGT